MQQPKSASCRVFIPSQTPRPNTRNPSIWWVTMLKTPRESWWKDGRFNWEGFWEIFHKKIRWCSWMIQSMFFFFFGMVTSREKNNTNHEQNCLFMVWKPWHVGSRVSKVMRQKGSRSQIWEFWLKKSGSVCFFTRFFFEEKQEADFHIYFLGEFVSDM